MQSPQSPQSPIAKAAAFFLVVVALIPLTKTNATNREPDTFLFGYGTRVSLEQPALNNVLRVIKKTGFDWLAIDYAWQNHWPQQKAHPQWEQLDSFMAFAQDQEMSVMLSITASPSWAKGENGPLPQETANLLVTLLKRYPNTLQAVELFPGPNTVQGWGTEPNPREYVQLLSHIYQTLEANNLHVKIIVGGLVPLSGTESAPGDVNDLEYLKGLYEAQSTMRGSTPMPVIGLRLPHPVGDPGRRDSSQEVVIRHYEGIRQIMLDNGQKSNTIWITGFTWPSNFPGAPGPNTINQQTQWLQEAYQWISSQIYIGAAFFAPRVDSQESSDYTYFALQGLNPQISSAKPTGHTSLPTKHRLKFAPKFLPTLFPSKP